MAQRRKRGKSQSKKHKKHRLFLGIHHALTFSFLSLLVSLLAWHLLIPSPQTQVAYPASLPGSSASWGDASHYQRKNQVYTFLLAGSDQGNGNADTIMVLRFDGNSGELNLVSVPRDTLVHRSWSQFPKINAAMSKGITLLQEEVSYTLGIPLDYYVQVSLDAFVAVIDALGGLEFHVPQDMYHDDQGGFIIDLQEGLQTLDGRHTLELVRYRGYATADIGRTETQQAVLKALATQSLRLETLGKLDDLWEIFHSHVNTNLEYQDFLWFGKKLLENVSNFSLESTTLLGNGEAQYQGYRYCYALYPESTLETVNLYLNPYETPRKQEDMNLVIP